jgi:hypothetical protein
MAVYTGLAIGNNGTGNFLYAANTSEGRIDTFDNHWNLVSPGPESFPFQDPLLAQNATPWRPFNVQNLAGILYVTYRNANDTEHGGIVDAFDTAGNFLRRVVTGGLNAPWGLALAPGDFGRFSGDLLVGNFGLGDGKINAYDLSTGRFLGYLTDSNGVPLAFEGLWSIAFGNGGSGGDANTLYFAAGINRTGAGSFGARDGLFGSIRFTAFFGPGGGNAPTLPPGSGSGSGIGLTDSATLAGLLLGLEPGSNQGTQRPEPAGAGSTVIAGVPAATLNSVVTALGTGDSLRGQQDSISTDAARALASSTDLASNAVFSTVQQDGTGA